MPLYAFSIYDEVDGEDDIVFVVAEDEYKAEEKMAFSLSGDESMTTWAMVPQEYVREGI